MDVLDKFFTKYSYKFPKGYPDLKDKQDILLMESILEGLDVKINLREAATPDTEDLHEIFTAMFVAGHNPVDDFENADWEIEVDNTPLLLKKQKHKDGIQKYINSDLPLKSSYEKIYYDAKKIADQLQTNLGYDVAEAERVFPEGQKEKADILIYQVFGEADKVADKSLGVSLKYGKGQFNSLSPNSVLKNLYGLEDLKSPEIDPETGKKIKVDGILSQVTKDDKEATKSIDKGAKAYIDFILDNYKKPLLNKNPKGDTKKYIDGTFKNDDKTPNPLDGKKYSKIIDDVAKNGTIPVRKKGEVPIKDMNWGLWSAANKGVQKAFSKAYGANPLTMPDIKDPFLKIKSKSINTVVQKYIEDKTKVPLDTIIDGKSDGGKQIIKFLTVILGAGERSYYYIGDGGKKSTFIPSVERLQNDIEYIIIPKYNEKSGDFIIDLIVAGRKKGKKDWIPLFSTDVKLRFSGQGGQFTSDITQKGSDFIIGKTGNEINMNELFGFNN